eukprot:scaffold14476_cov120-Isochrysis_galbana.AAC.13
MTSDITSDRNTPRRRFSLRLVGRRGRLRRGGGEAQSAPPLRAPDSAGPTAPPSNVTAAPGMDPDRENADVCQVPGLRHCWAWCTGWVQRQRLTLGHVAVLCPCLSPPG